MDALVIYNRSRLDCWGCRDGTIFLQTPRRRPRSTSRRLITNEIEFAPEVGQTVQDIRSDSSPFNWTVCGYDSSDGSTQRMIVVEKGMVCNHLAQTSRNVPLS